MQFLSEGRFVTAASPLRQQEEKGRVGCMENVDRANYGQLVLNLARLTVDLAIERAFYPELPARAQLEQNPSFAARFRQFQPPLSRLEKTLAQESVEYQEAAESLQAVLDKLRTFLAT
jgi:hypothetical protein